MSNTRRRHASDQARRAARAEAMDDSTPPPPPQQQQQQRSSARHTQPTESTSVSTASMADSLLPVVESASPPSATASVASSATPAAATPLHRQAGGGSSATGRKRRRAIHDNTLAWHELSATDDAQAVATDANERADQASNPPLPVKRRLLRARRSRRRACYIDGLASVEVQSIMQLLDCTSLLALARCSRRLHSDANADLAWKHQPALEVELSADDLDVGARIRRSLVSRCPGVSVTLDCTASRLTGALIDALLTIPRITRINLTSYAPIDLEQCTRIMQHEAMDSLRELVIEYPWHMPIGFTDQLVRLPHLHTLRLGDVAPQDDSLTALPQLAHLTSLQVIDADPSRLPMVAQCASLVELHLAWPKFNANLFLAFFASPNMSRLSRLTIQYFDAASPETDFVAAFQSLTRLLHLRLDTVSNVDLMLFGAAHAPALLELTIRSTFYQPRSRASAEALANLLQRSSNLRVSLEGLSVDSRAQYTDLLAAYPHLSITE